MVLFRQLSFDVKLFIFITGISFLCRTPLDTKCKESFKCTVGRYSENKAQAVLCDEQIQKESLAGKHLVIIL